MTQLISRHCPHCKKYQTLIFTKQETFNCPDCQKEWGTLKNKEDLFDQCPMCPARQFYITKDFNQILGCAVMLVAIVLVPWTYGLSLPVLALVDWLLHKKAGTVICCYRCGTEFRGFGNPKNFKNFMHHIGLKYDKYR